MAVIDVSFISVRLILPTLARELAPCEWLVMVKPQFEVGKGRVGKGGVVREPELRAEAVADVVRCAHELGWEALGRVDSRLAGPKGNLEIFVQFRPRSADGPLDPASV